MLKRLELTEPSSCINKALDNEMVFVLLARDEAAPVAIAAWIKERITSGKNNAGDALISEAIECIKTMEKTREAIRTAKDAQMSFGSDPRIAAGVEAAHPDKPQGVNALLDPLCTCGHTASDHVGRTGPCRRTPCGVRCKCNEMIVKI